MALLVDVLVQVGSIHIRRGNKQSGIKDGKIRVLGVRTL